MSDKEIKCSECGEVFVFTEKEQEFFKTKDFQDPKRCIKCRKGRKIDISEIIEDLTNLIFDLDFKPEEDFLIDHIQEDKGYKIQINCKNNHLSRILLYDGGDLAGAFRKIVKAIGRRKGVYLNIDVKKPDDSSS